ncbi:MAG: HAD family phosphatase [Gemmataceae bacterium]
MTIRAIVFDFGNVVGFFERARAAANLAVYAVQRFDLTRAMHLLTHSEYERLYETNQISTAEILALMRQELGLEGSDEQLAHAFADMFTPNEAVCSLIPQLAGRYHLALLSNANEMHYRHFRREFAWVLDRFDQLVASHLVGLRKPDPAIYRLVQQQAGCGAQEVIFVDDLPANLEAAGQLGWRTIPYDKDVNLAWELQRHGVELWPA